MRIGVILNPNASGAKERGLARRLAATLGDLGDVVETRTPEELHVAVARFAREGRELVATCGGDGTNLSTITQVVSAYGVEHVPRIAILRGGTVNTVAANLGIDGRPDEILGRIVARLRSGGSAVESQQDLLEVNGMYGFLFASAMGARFLEAYYGGLVQGVAWASVLAARTVGSSLVPGGGRFARWLFAPVPCEIVADGERLPIREVKLLLASTVPDVGIGMKVTWQAGTRPQRFHLIASSLPLVRMGMQLHRVLAGLPLEGQPHEDRLAERVEIRFATPQTFTLDGDLFRDRRIHIAIGPRLTIVKG